MSQRGPGPALRRWLDMPPLWLAGVLCLSWSSTRIFPALVYDSKVFDFVGGVLVGGAVLLAGFAVGELRRSATTPIPHRTASTLVQTGPFRWSRNPIYVADLLIFTGMTLFWGALICLPLGGLLGWILLDRFVRPEEARLHAAFGPAFADYCARTRRWI